MHFGKENEYRREVVGSCKILDIIGTSLNYIIFGAFRETFRIKITLIIGKKFEIMLDIIIVFWEIWLDIVLNISFF